jgi:hypothetical protein
MTHSHPGHRETQHPARRVRRIASEIGQALQEEMPDEGHHETLGLATNDMPTRILPKAAGRARRFALQLRVCYREANSPTWFEAETYNISRTGVLFGCSRPLRLETPAELRLQLAVGRGDEHPVEAFCKGTVVRVEQGRGLAAPTALAVAIGRARIVRGYVFPGSLAQCAPR